MPDFKTTLRPTYTKKIYERIVLQGNSTNIIGAKSAGTDRLLKDLKKVLEAEGKRALYIDFRASYTYVDFVTTLQRAFNTVPGGQSVSEAALSSLNKQQPYIQYVSITEICQPVLYTDQQLVLLFGNLHRIFRPERQHFPKSFFNELNALNNQSNIRLCCTSEKDLCTYQINFIDDQAGYTLQESTSWLDLPSLNLPALQAIEVRQELERTIGTAWTNCKEQQAYIEAVLAHEESASFLRYLGNHFEEGYHRNNSRRHLRKLQKRYRKNHTHPVPWQERVENPLNLLDRIAEIIHKVRK